MTSEAEQGNAVEDFKRTSTFLRIDTGRILDNDATHESNRAEPTLKLHGTYAQGKPDVRRPRALKCGGLDYIFMLRIEVPGGQLSPTHVGCSTSWAPQRPTNEFNSPPTKRCNSTTRRRTTRPMAHSSDTDLMTSFGACGEVVINVSSSPNLPRDGTEVRVSEITQLLTKQ